LNRQDAKSAKRKKRGGKREKIKAFDILDFRVSLGLFLFPLFFLLALLAAWRFNSPNSKDGR
jgi:hypothetical protein